ncbi:transposase [Vibrio harveyi]
MKLEGVGETIAAMLYSTLGDGLQFKNGRQASAFIGLTPKQYSTGGKVVMMGIDKYGGVKDLRSLLPWCYGLHQSAVTGASYAKRCVVTQSGEKTRF